MTLCTISTIDDRLRAASPSSPLALFLPADNPGRLECVFADTIITQERIARNESDYIGTFHTRDDLTIRRLANIAASRYHQMRLTK